jgi:two-component system phosphate regulon sensor histidine kinase PhoR
MRDELTISSLQLKLRRGADYLVKAAPLLVAFAVILLGLVLFARLNAEGAGLALLLAFISVVFLGKLQITERSKPVSIVEVPAPNNPLANGFPFADALVDPCFVLDRKSLVLHANAAARRLYPVIQQGKPITFSLRNPQLVDAVDGALSTGRVRSFELHETFPSETWDKVVVSPVLHPDKTWLEDEDRQLIVTFQSLTELKRIDALRSDFIANASHELRTPLASLSGFIDTLLGPAAKDPAAQQKFLEIMRGQAERMSRLIEDMLSLSRIEMHQHILPTASVDLAALLREVRDGLTTQAQAADLEIKLSLPSGPANTLGDRNQLYEVFENLLDNAIKYGVGGKTVEVSLEVASRGSYGHAITVLDHGPGVDVEQVPRLTERFYRVDAETSRKKKGTGLGLAIVKHIVHRHRGALSIKSKPGEGMRVEVLLP